MPTVRVEFGPRSYDVVVGPGMLRRLAELLGPVHDRAPIPRALVVTDEHVAPHYLEVVAASLADRVPRVDVCVLPAGEEHKDLGGIERIWRAALEVDADRRMLLVGLGGGVVGDLTGLAAATLLRGVRLMQLPTSLLAQVDASVGGKTAINLERGRNLVGAFKQPVLVVADTAALATLPARELRGGMAEVVKHAVIRDAALLDRIDLWARSGGRPDDPLLRAIIARCIDIKAAVVAEDERETGPRRILNFGHTIGHALERVRGYGTLSHGEAVALGMLAAARLGAHLGLGARELPARLRTTLAALGLPTRYPGGTDRAALAAAVAHDKKRTGDRVGFVLCPALGSARVEPIDFEVLGSWIEADDDR